MLQQQIREMNSQNQKLHSSMDFEIVDKINDTIASANSAPLEEKSGFQLQEIRELHGKVKDMEAELKNYHQENSRLKAKSMNLHEQLLHTRGALERGVQETISIDEENLFFKQRLCSLEARIQDDGKKQSNGARRSDEGSVHNGLEGDGVKDMCSTCRSSSIHSSRRSPKQYGVFDSYSATRKFLNETWDMQISDIFMREACKRRLFDETDGSNFEIRHEEKFQNCVESRSRPAPGNAAHSDDTIPALSHLCCQFKQFADPSTQRKEPCGEEPTLSQETKNLKLSLYLANRLGSELLQELYSIAHHDVRCLEVHAASTGTVGKSLEALQMLLAESANVGLRLFSNLSSVASTKLQQLIQEVADNWASTYPEDSGESEIGSVVVSDDIQLLLEESVSPIHSRHDIEGGEGMNCWSASSKGVADSARPNSSWDHSLEDASLTPSPDAGEDICNIDLHEACDEKPGSELSSDGPSHRVSLDVHMLDEHQSIEINQYCLPKVQFEENFAEELKIVQNMRESEKQFSNQLLNKMETLEARLTVAEMEIVEYKVEIEHLRVNNLRASMEVSLHSDDWELQNLRVECEIQKEEIQQLMEQVMTPDDVLERESLLRETIERNNFLENCLKKAKMRLRMAEGWRNELRQFREAESRKELSPSAEAAKQGSSKTPLDTKSACNEDELKHLRGPDRRPLQPASTDVHNNWLQPCILIDLGELYKSNDLELRKSNRSDQLEKDNHFFVLSSPR